MNLPKISLDTNVIIFGLRNLDPSAAMLLKSLFLFDVSLCFQVERELRKNLAEHEFRQFYDPVGLLPTLSISYQPIGEQIIAHYRQFGLKTGDALIAAFCEQEAVEILISENRHFLKELPTRTFEIMDSEHFCQKFSLV